MNDTLSIRLINETEKEIIGSTLSHIVLKPDEFTQNLYISLTERDKLSVYLVPEQLVNELIKFANYDSLISVGLYFGFIRKGFFFLSLEAADFFLEENLISDQNILNVNNKGEKAVLYGNPIIKKMVLNVPTNMQKNAILFVLNESKELIALVRTAIDYTNFKLLNQGDLVANNLIDKGYYLRRKQ